MSWLFELPRSVPTKHNGVMRLFRLFGQWHLRGHDGTEQATPYIAALWTRALRSPFLDDATPKRVLLLGVATGAVFDIVLRRFPAAEIVGVDWEPELAALGKTLGIWKEDTRIRFVEGDAASVVPALAGTFDLILVDLFCGREVADVVRDGAFQDAVAAKTSPGGLVLVNCYFDYGALDGWRARFERLGRIRYKANTVGAFGPVEAADAIAAPSRPRRSPAV